MTTQKTAIELAIEALHDAEMHFLMEAGKDAGSPCETRSARHRWNTKQAVYFHEAHEALRAAQKVDVEILNRRGRVFVDEEMPNVPMTVKKAESSLIKKWNDHLAATGYLNAIPEGYALVPLEPTPDMLGAIEKGEIHTVFLFIVGAIAAYTAA